MSRAFILFLWRGLFKIFWPAVKEKIPERNITILGQEPFFESFILRRESSKSVDVRRLPISAFKFLTFCALANEANVISNGSVTRKSGFWGTRKKTSSIGLNPQVEHGL